MKAVKTGWSIANSFYVSLEEVMHAYLVQTSGKLRMAIPYQRRNKRASVCLAKAETKVMPTRVDAQSLSTRIWVTGRAQPY